MDSEEMMEANDNVRCIPAAKMEESERENYSPGRGHEREGNEVTRQKTLPDEGINNPATRIVTLIDVSVENMTTKAISIPCGGGHGSLVELSGEEISRNISKCQTDLQLEHQFEGLSEGTSQSTSGDTIRKETSVKNTVNENKQNTFDVVNEATGVHAATTSHSSPGDVTQNFEQNVNLQMDASGRREVQQPEGIIDCSRRQVVVPLNRQWSNEIINFRSKASRKEYQAAEGTVQAHLSPECKSSDRAPSSNVLLKNKGNVRQKKTDEKGGTQPVKNAMPARLRNKRKREEQEQSSPLQADSKNFSGQHEKDNKKQPASPLLTPAQPQSQSKRTRHNHEKVSIMVADSQIAEEVRSPDMSFGGSSNRSMENKSSQAATGLSLVRGVVRYTRKTRQTPLSVVDKTEQNNNRTRTQPQRRAKLSVVSYRRSTCRVKSVINNAKKKKSNNSADKSCRKKPKAAHGGLQKPPEARAKKKKAPQRPKKLLVAKKRYSPEAQWKLLEEMTRNCPYCEFVAKSRVQVKGHLLTDCKTLQDIPEVKQILQNMLEKGINAPKPNTYKYETCPMDGICYLANLQYPHGTILAPHGWCYINFGFNKEKYGEGIFRRTCQAQEYRIKRGTRTRVRTYTDRSIHHLWESKVRQLIERDEVQELIIPVCFWFLRANVFKASRHKNHCAVIVMKLCKGFVMEYKYYDSIEDLEYFNQAANETVSTAISNILRLKNRIKLTRADPYRSLVGDGCQGVQAYFLFQRFLNREINHPPNMETIQFWKCFLFNCPESVDMKGEQFDKRWLFSSKLNRRTQDEDPEMENYLKDQYCKILCRPEFRDLE